MCSLMANCRFLEDNLPLSITSKQVLYHYRPCASFEARSSPMHQLSVHLFTHLSSSPSFKLLQGCICRGELKMGKPAEYSIDILGNNSLFVRESLHFFYRSKANLLDMLLKCFSGLARSYLLVVSYRLAFAFF
jgi:hypothetical protein